MYALLLARFAELTPGLKDNSNDLHIYRETGEAVLRGELPYRDFFIEYPPGSVPAFVPPALFSDSRDAYMTLFANEMALALVAALVLVALAARRVWTASSWSVPAFTFAASAVLLYPVAVTRYDAVVALTLALAALCAARGGRAATIVAYASLGFGAAAKLVPALAALPLALARRRSAVVGLAVFFAVVALFFGPAVLLAGGQFAESFAYHAQRGLQVESVAASVLMQLGWVEKIVFEFGAFEAQGRAADFASAASLPLTALLLGLTALVVYRKHRGGLGPELFARHAAALILAFMLGSKVLSPQYMIWLFPLLPLAAPGLAGVGVSALFLTVCWLTTQIFPIHYPDLLSLRSPGPELLLARNILIVFLWAMMLLLPTGERSGKTAP